jgi:uncharacterized repeat protein (TIGR01451 family)
MAGKGVFFDFITFFITFHNLFPMRNFTLLSLLFFSLPLLLNAQLSWQKLNGPSGGGYRVYPGKDGYIFSVESGNALYRSGNGGQSWEKMPQTPANIWYWPLVVGADGNMYAGKSQQLYRSTNNGVSWTLLNNNIFHESIYALPGGEILIGDYSDKIKRSTDNGQTWTVVSDSADATGGFARNPNNGDVYAWGGYPATGEPGKLWRSPDEGQTWTMVLEGTGLRPYQMAFSPNGAVFVGAEDLIWRTLDNGATWTSLGAFFNNSSREISVGVSPTGRLFAHEWYISKYSDDNGNTWTPLTDESGNAFQAFSGPIDGKMFALRETGSLYATADNGATWQFAANNIFRSTMYNIIHLDAARILARTGDGLFYTADGGNSWDLIWDKLSDENLSFFENQILTAAPDGSWYLWSGINLIRFSQSGQTNAVLPLPPGINKSSFQGIWCHPFSNTVFVAGYTGLYASQDAGQHWTLYSAYAPETLLFLPDGSMLSFGFGGSFKSTDNGLNWTKISDISFQSGSVTLASDGLLYGITLNNELMVSPDGGLTWDTRPINNTFNLTNPVVNNAGHIFLYDYFNNLVFRSVDGGLTFNQLSGPNPDGGGAYGTPMSMGAAQHLFVAQTADGLYRTTNPTDQVKLLTGKAWFDVDGNCTYAQPDSLMKGLLVKVSNNNETVYGYSNAQGEYRCTVDDGTYQVSVVTPSDYWLSCNATANISAGTQTGVVDSADIGLRILTECPLATVSVSAPFLRRCFDSPVFVRYENTGTLPAENAYVTITLDSLLEFVSASLPVSAQNGNSYTFQLGNLSVGAVGSMNLVIKPSCLAPLGYTHCLEAHIYPDELCPPLTGPHIVTDAACLGDSIELRIHNIGDAATSAPLDWYALHTGFTNDPDYGVSASGSVSLSAGGTFSTKIASVPGDIHFYTDQAPEYPFNTVSRTVIRGCDAAPGSEPLAIFSEDEAGPFTDKFCQPNIGAFDPNDKQGIPAGLTDKGYIEKEQPLSYLIRFQNTGTDTAFNVSIRDALPPALDPASVRLVNSSHPCVMRVLPEGALLFVFENILLPDSNINEAASHGFVQFSVQQVAGNPLGLQIRNSAAIYFDFNEPVITNQTLHTVGIPILTGVKNNSATEISLVARPNPFHESFTVDLGAGFRQSSLRLLLYDNTGRAVLEKGFETGSVNIQRNSLPNGIYHFVVLGTGGNRVGSGTVLAE